MMTASDSGLNLKRADRRVPGLLIPNEGIRNEETDICS